MYIKILTNSIANRLEKNNLKAYTFTLQIKYANFKQYSKSITLQEPLNDNYAIYHIMHNLFEDLYDNENAVRLLGVGAAKLIESQAITKQYTLFDNLNEVEKEHEVEKIINGINNSLGQTIIARGINKIKNNKDE